ncbi:hypothetical protein K432DRAFT_459400 [Lepidopterella palustris CBS 459.81]|uniref:Uncharacterized protein n=1 Tax=Lepidopterella palustris CBS 459.81 TaxID=1314670 RepID=A0A8E2JDB4_9PEZI|nr:hypothetical protein K432DRAFT_459400 [Lepidopterella palustris CBS 459.81]
MMDLHQQWPMTQLTFTPWNLKFADEGKDIVLASHAYGGVDATESAKGLSRRTARKMGRKEGLSDWRIYGRSCLLQVMQCKVYMLKDGIVDYITVEASSSFLFPCLQSHFNISEIPGMQATMAPIV